MTPLQRVGLALIFPFALIYYSLVALVKLFTPNKLLKVKDITANDIVLVTGGGMGLGREIAKQFVQHGCRNMVIWDVNEGAMKESKAILESLGCKVWTFKVDVTEYQEVLTAAETVKTNVGTVTYLVNNAGIVAGKPILELQPRHVKGVFDVNTISHFWTVQAFLPGMLREKGHIITVASVVGLMSAPFLSEYVASKFGAVGFHESLRLELQHLPNGDNVDTTLVCPWMISTGMFSGVDTGLLAALTPQFVAQSVLDALLARRGFLVVPFSLRVMFTLLSILPNEVVDLLFRITSNPTAAKDLIGRKTFD